MNRFEQLPAGQLAANEDFWIGIRNGYKLKPDYINLENGYYNFLPESLLENFIGHVRMIQGVMNLMPAGSHIVNIGSMGGFQGSMKFPGLSAYSASKAALHTLTECLAQEFAEQGIKVNCLAIGSAQTEMLEEAFPGYQSPVMAFEMGKYIADFSITGHRFFNGKVLPVAVTTP